MYDTSARVARVKVRVRQLRRRREKRAIGALSALCLLLAASLVRGAECGDGWCAGHGAGNVRHHAAV